VVVSLLRSCGVCERCLEGSPHLCTGEFDLQRSSRLRSRQGQPIRQGINTAAFAESVVVDQSQLAVVPTEMPSASAALLACGVVTGVGAVLNTARVRPGSSVAVLGVGGVGLNAIQGSLLAGANPIVAMDLLESKLEAARMFGATHCLRADSGGLVDAVRSLTGGRMLDYVFVTVGSASAAAQAYALLGKRGTLVLVGLPSVDAAVSVPIWPSVMGETRIIGSFMGSTRLRQDVRKLVALYESHRLKLDELISGRFPLGRINEAIRATDSGSARRNVIVFDQEVGA
jgi:Zn-dependent alcohol dehydrogenase